MPTVLRWLVPLLLVAPLPATAADLAPKNLRCEYLANPIGLGETAPRFSWIVASEKRGQLQTAYQILVASSLDALAANQGDLWDSGKVDSDQSVHVAYAGKALTSRMTAHWTVRVWDKKGEASAYGTPASFEMGLLNRGDWRAQWISLADPPPAPDAIDASSAKWIWLPGETSKDAGEVKAFFRRNLDVAAGIKRARILITADDHFVLFVNGKRTAKSKEVAEPWREPLTVDITSALVAGSNCFAVKAVNSVSDAGLLVQIVIENGDGTTQLASSNAEWQVATDVPDGWEQPGFDDHAWGKAREVHAYGDGVWGASLGLTPPPQPAPYLRKAFTVNGTIKRARLYVTALGFYEMRVNGERVGRDFFTPGCTDYRKRIQYQTYDVTALLRPGDNALGAILGDGWYAGNIGWGQRRYHFGRYPLALCAQLEIDYEGGTKDSVFSDATWHGRRGPIQLGDMLLGETYDARLEMPGWDRAPFAAPSQDRDWQPVITHEAPAAPLVAQRDIPVRRVEELAAKKVTEPQKGVFVFDLEQNMVGFVRLKVNGPAGTQVTLRFAEVLNPEGTLYTTNLRGATCIDHYTLKGGGEEIWEPRFTFHGFRYVEVSGYPGTPALDAVTGVVLSSATQPAGSFTCSSDLLNRLQHNIVWGQRGNFLSIPTDCPQRDERLGWMGDAQIFARTAAFNFDVAAFFNKWMDDVVDAQSAEGGFADVSPRVVDVADGAPAWGDAGVIVPWTVYQCYGDTRILERHYEAMKKWVEYIHQANPDHLWVNRRNNDFGDWVSVGSDTPKDVLACAFYHLSTSLLAKSAHVIGRTDDEKQYEQLAQQIRAAFNTAFVAADGRIKGDTQTCYALALEFDLLPVDKRPLALRYLVEDIAKHQWHLTTGFLGVNRLLPALTHDGFADVAFRLALNETFPSWGYCVRQGATTIWERWDGWTVDKGFQDPGMNSFNHYAFGSVGEWLYETIGGIARDPSSAGYKHIVVHPRAEGGVTRAAAALDSMYGRIASDWKRDGDQFSLALTVPANTTALVYVPATAKESVTESGKAIDQVDDILFQRMEDHCALFAVNSGHYEFRSQLGPGANQNPPQGFTALFNGKDLSGWKGLVADPPARAKMSKDELANAQVVADPRAKQHWTVFDGVITYDGLDNSLCTVRDYGDFELALEWRILPGGDSGIYVRGAPQIQIWDNPLGSGGLYNNKQGPSNPSKVADRPVGEWNHFRILMVGDRVTVHLNGELVVDQVPLENYWERDKPIYPSGQIELQHHGAPLFFRNVFLREIPRGN